jgi:RimJ/RimL family protein N-acetyltransferase
MQLRCLEAGDVATVAGWLADVANHQWLDFGYGQQVLSAPALALMRQRPIHDLRLFAADGREPAIGVVALSSISRPFRTATLWYVLGDKRYGGRGYTTLAVRAMLEVAFGPLGLRAVNAWAVAVNWASIRVLEKAGFQRIGVQRACHEIDGRVYDRILFDRLVSDEAVR